MARSRSLPTDLFEQPDFFELESETQIILVGLALGADDYGRGVAHRRLLARKLDKAEHVIDQALKMLEARAWLCCYQVGRTRYYALSCWREWQSLHKPTPSKYPAPPISPSDPSLPQDVRPSENIMNHSGFPQISPERSGDAGEIRPEDEDEDESEPNKKRNEDEEEAPLATIITSPASPTNVGADDVALSQEVIVQKTHQVAQILQLPISEALMRVVVDYGADRSLSLLGEADAAREWIEDRQRNHRGQVMTPAFFRRWLGREQGSMQARQQAYRQGSTLRTPTVRTGRRRALSAPAEDPYAAFVERRVRELAAEDALHTAQQREVAIV